MSWSVSGIVDDGNTEELEQNFNNNHPSSTDDVREQFNFVLTVVSDAFDEGVVEGYYNVSASGHTDPTTEGDRKSLSLSFTPYVRPETEVLTTTKQELQAAPQTETNTSGNATPDELPEEEDTE